MRHPLNGNSGEALKEMFRRETDGAKNLEGVRTGVCSVVRFVANQGRIAFASGIISGDGPQFIDRNMAILAAYTDHLRRDSTIPVTSATDIFHKELLDKHRNHTKEEWAGFWRSVLRSGVTRLIMTPRWHLSYGAIDEHDFAKERKMEIEYRYADPPLVGILRGHGVQL